VWSSRHPEPGKNAHAARIAAISFASLFLVAGVILTQSALRSSWSQFRALGIAYLAVSAAGMLMIMGASIRTIFRRKRAAWRMRYGLCARCGYDLTGNLSGRCPERGEQVPDLDE
jgi:hypothetical protein